MIKTTGKSFVSFLWIVVRIFICTVVFSAAMIMGGMLAGFLGIAMPQIPPEIDVTKAGQLIPLVGILMSVVLAIFSRYFGVRYIPRWLILSILSMTAFGLNNNLEGRLFFPSMATNYSLVSNLIACLACSAVVAWLFKPSMPVEAFWVQIQIFFAARSSGSWTWRLLIAWIAFPVIYFFFGKLVSPFVLPYYLQQYSGLALPTQTEMFKLSILRSFFFLISILPVLIVWKGNRNGLFFLLAISLFLMVGGMNMLQAIWLPLDLRTAHSIEILADSFSHAAVLVYLLVPKQLVKTAELK